MVINETCEPQGDLPIVNFLDPGFRADPFAPFRSLYADHHVATDALGATRILFRFDDVETLLRDPRVSVSDYVPLTGRTDGPLLHFLRTQLLADNPPEHTRLRRLMTKAFTPRRVELLRGRIEGLVGDLLDQAADRGNMDVIADLGFPMPVIVICELLGVDAEDRHLLQGWSATLAAALDPIFDPELHARADDAVVNLRTYISELIEDRRRSPRDGLLSDLIAAEEEGDRLSHEELICNALLLLFAGHETTKNLIGNGLLALLQHPDQMDVLRRDRAVLPGAIEEMLRFDPPVGLVGRKAAADIEIDGVTVPESSTLAFAIFAANRDPAQIDDPDRFDVTRSSVRHLSFGAGAHYCLGAPLARIEAQLAFDAMLTRFTSIELATDQIRRQESFVLRGVDSLPVAVKPS